MDQQAPRVEAVIASGHHRTGAGTGAGAYYDVYEVTRAMERQWESWETLDDRALGSLDAAIHYLQDVRGAIEDESTGEYPPATAETVRTGFAASDWIKQALDTLAARDPVDALNDAEVLVRLLQQRCRRILQEVNDARHD